MYLTDLVFIEEGTPNYTEDGLVNFSKMRMVSLPGQMGHNLLQTEPIQPLPQHSLCLTQKASSRNHG